MVVFVLTVALALFSPVASYMLWRGKWTFLISGYRKFNKETTDMEKVHHSNAIFLTVIFLPTFAMIALGMYLEISSLSWIAMVWMVVGLIIQIVYEKTGNRFAK